MADMAGSSIVIVDLGEGKQVIVSGTREIYLQVWAHRGSLGVLLTIEQADELKKALLAAIVRAAVENIDA